MVVAQVFDCWFESGSMSYAYIHYPFENWELFEKNFPGNFVAESLDQTFGWFVTLFQNSMSYIISFIRVMIGGSIFFLKFLQLWPVVMFHDYAMHVVSYCWHEQLANLNLNCQRAAWPEAAWIELKCNKFSHNTRERRLLHI